MKSRPRQSFVAEIIGPAGSGKSTLTQLLRNKQTVRAGLSVWGLPLPLLLRTAVLTFPTLLRLYAYPRLRWDDLKLVIQHNALLQLLRRERTAGHAALLLDEGNLFAIAKLRAFGRNVATADSCEPWLQKLVDATAPELDAVIWLDAPDSILAQRIREREKDHRMKNKSDAEIENHLSLYRSSFERVVEELRRRNRDGLKVLRFSTDQLPVEQIADSIMAQAGVSA